MNTTLHAIDLFAGLGGFTTAAAQAGVSVVWAANHWPLAVQVHAANHPGTSHVCQDLHLANWLDVPRPVDLILASPCCQGHSHARGVDRPQHDASRATAWCVVSSCEALRPAAFIVENVPEFLDWSLYPAWRSALEILGYHLTAQVLDAADYGVPQHRRRVFVIGHRGQPIAVESASQPHVPVADFIDWGDRYAWSLIDRPGRSPATLRRIAAGRAAHGSRFVAPYYGSGSGLSGRSVDRPIGTITTLDRWAVIDGERMRMLQPAELSTIMGFPADYQLAGNRRERIQLIGNAVCPPVGSAVISHVAQCLN